nr:hypothetical protein [Streptomonospora nanhaiensis]
MNGGGDGSGDGGQAPDRVDGADREDRVEREGRAERVHHRVGERAGPHAGGGAEGLGGPAGGRPPGVPALGVDVGGVIIRRSDGDQDTSFFGEHPMRTPAVEGAFEALAELAAGPFDGRVYVISKAKPDTAHRTIEWLHHHDFERRTGITRERMHFVLNRGDKAPVCERLGITHFVDDRIDVLRHLTMVPHRYLFTGGLGDEPRPTVIPPWAEHTDDWKALAESIRRSVAEEYRPTA